jgi:hypothetical protein
MNDTTFDTMNNTTFDTMNNTTAPPPTLYVAPDGDDGNPGTLEQPFRSLERARDQLRQAQNADQTTVYLRGGNYFLEHSILFDERDSAELNRVTYRSYPGEQAVLVGGQPVTGWLPYRDGIYKTQLKPGWQFSCLFERDQRAVMARLPKRDYFTVKGKVVGREDSSFVFDAADLPPNANYQDAQVYIWPGEAGWNWFSQTQPVALDWGNHTATMPSRAAWGIDQGARYFVQGVLEFLSEPGEFHLDTQTHTLYYHPHSVDSLEGGVVAATTRRLLELRGASPQQPVHGLSFEDLTLFLSDFTPRYDMPVAEAQNGDNSEREGLVYLENAQDIQVQRCRILGAGYSGVMLARCAQRNRIENNLVQDSGYNGIYLSGWAPGEGGFARLEDAYVNKHNHIRNNLICDGGRLVGHGSGIQLVQSGDNQIEHNEICRFPRYGISLKGWRFGIMERHYYGLKVTWENHWDFLFTRDNQVRFNDIHHVLQDTQDGGGIEGWGPGKGNVIDHNHLHHFGTSLPGGMTFGLYLDDACDYFTVTNNLIHHLWGDLLACAFVKGIYNHIHNNILADSPGDAAFRFHSYMGERNDHLDVSHNILYQAWRENALWFDDWTDDKVSRFDSNSYFHPEGLYGIQGECPAANLVQWQQLDGKAFDQHSTIANPLFVDPDVGDYRLHPDSPALKLGFKPIELAQIGLSPDFFIPKKARP